MINRINAVQAARDHKPASVVPIVLVRQSRRSSAEDEGCREGNLGFGQHFTSPICLIEFVVSAIDQRRRRFIPGLMSLDLIHPWFRNKSRSLSI
jgi:hypothetical protein